MFKPYEDEKLRAQVATERHTTLRIIGGAFFAFAFLATMIVSIAYYNVKALEVPVKYEHNESVDYERGGSNE